MSALGTIWLPLKYMSVAHNLTDHGSRRISSNSSRASTNGWRIKGLEALSIPTDLASGINARVLLIARPVHFQAEALKLYTTIATNLKELGYGG